MHACSTSSWLHAVFAVSCSYVLAFRASPPHAEMTRLVAVRYGGESASVPSCLCDGTGILLHFFLRNDHNPISICVLRESPSFAGRQPEREREHCSLENKKLNVFYAARVRRPLSNDVPEHYFLFFISELFNILLLRRCV